MKNYQFMDASLWQACLFVRQNKGGQSGVTRPLLLLVGRLYLIACICSYKRDCLW